jgi:hypothetical protein
MTNDIQPPFYSNPVPLDRSRHGDCAIRLDQRFAYSKGINAVPVNLVEMPQLCHEYPIAFSPNEAATPVAVLGLRTSENLFVDDGGDWLSDAYIPGYVRRYPFIFGDDPVARQLTLCVDEPALHEGSGEGFERLFKEDGSPTPLAQGAMEFCQSYFKAAQETQVFCQALAASGLLKPLEAVFQNDERRLTFRGFQVIDEEQFNEADDDAFLEWRQKGWLPAIYAHLFSQSRWDRLGELLQQRLDTSA